LQGDFLVHKKVVSDSSESGMFLGIKHEYNITSHEVGYLFTFAFYYYCVTICMPLLYNKLYVGIIVDHALSAAMIANVCHRFSFPATFGAMCLHLDLHSKAHLDVLHNYSLAFALGTGLLQAIFGSSPFAWLTVNVPTDLNCSFTAVVHVL